MANQYSVEIHKYISDKIADAKNRIKSAQKINNIKARGFYEGQLYELIKIREYMADEFAHIQKIGISHISCLY